VVATSIHGETAADTIESGDVVPIVSGPQGGFHMELGMEVESWTPNVAWRIDLFDVASGDLSGASADRVHRAVGLRRVHLSWARLNGRVFIGDGSSQTHDFACELAGTPSRHAGGQSPSRPTGRSRPKASR
jgi:hypothetical protein